MNCARFRAHVYNPVVMSSLAILHITHDFTLLLSSSYLRSFQVFLKISRSIALYSRFKHSYQGLEAHFGALASIPSHSHKPRKVRKPLTTSTKFKIRVQRPVRPNLRSIRSNGSITPKAFASKPRERENGAKFGRTICHSCKWVEASGE